MMRKILMRAHMSPFNNPDFMEFTTHNLPGKNLGNLIFESSVCRTVMTEDTQMDFIKTNRNFSAEEVDRFNNEYDCFVIPLANAFRSSFMKELNFLSSLIERLRIPCVVVGVGFQKKLTEDRKNEFPFNKDARHFVKCVLEKSAMLGLRGEETAQYMEDLGFTPEKDFTVIGCPSMYFHGGKLPEFKKEKLTSDSAISINSNLYNDQKLHLFIEKNLPLFNNYHYVPQTIDELNVMYLGIPLPEGKYKNIPENYPTTFASTIYTNGHGIGFLNLSSWLRYLSEQDFSFGSRIHGNIAAIISGIPCYIIAADVRIKEIAQYHFIPHTAYTELPENTTIFDLYEKADYGPMFAHHSKNFHHYLDFLNANQIQHIYQDSDYVEDSPFDKKIKEISFRGPVKAFSDVSPEEQSERLRIYYEYLDKKIQKLENKTRKQKEKLDHKSVQMVLKLRRKLKRFA